MPFRGLNSRLRNDPLGPGGLASLSNNMQWLRGAAAEHIVSSGEHNSWLVARRCFTVASAGTSVTPSTGSGDVPTATHPATGSYALTLAANRFGSTIRPLVNINSDQIHSKPMIAAFKVSSATSMTFYLKQLSSALGAGNTWADHDAAFDVALHSTPLARGTWASDQIGHARGDTLTEGSTDWNAHVQAHGNMRKMLQVAHTSAGAHNVAEVARYYANVYYDGSAYKILTGSAGVTSVNRVSAGICEVNYTALTAPQFAFVSPDYQRNNSGSGAVIVSMNAERNSTTKHTVYMYKYDPAGNSWSVYDSDFFIAIHGS